MCNDEWRATSTGRDLHQLGDTRSTSSASGHTEKLLTVPAANSGKRCGLRIYSVSVCPPPPPLREGPFLKWFRSLSLSEPECTVTDACWPTFIVDSQPSTQPSRQRRRDNSSAHALPEWRHIFYRPVGDDANEPFETQLQSNGVEGIQTSNVRTLI